MGGHVAGRFQCHGRQRPHKQKRRSSALQRRSVSLHPGAQRSVRQRRAVLPHLTGVVTGKLSQLAQVPFRLPHGVPAGRGGRAARRHAATGSLEQARQQQQQGSSEPKATGSAWPNAAAQLHTLLCAQQASPPPHVNHATVSVQEQQPRNQRAAGPQGAAAAAVRSRREAGPHDMSLE
jgi:hypothetical protein